MIERGSTQTLYLIKAVYQPADPLSGARKHVGNQVPTKGAVDASGGAGLLVKQLHTYSIEWTGYVWVMAK